jgi:type III pantothenate kinase
VLLAVDVGNTHTGFGLFEGADVVEHWRIATDERRTADEIAVLLVGLLGVRAGLHPPVRSPDVVDGICICSTVPSVLTELRRMCRRYFARVPAVVVEPGVRTGVPVLTDNPKEVGTDRIVNALAAVTIYGGPAIVVDFGTATTFDAVSARGEYLGGAIAPGIEISVEALGARGAQLRRVEVRRPRSVIGRSTVEALQAGILYGFAGQVDGVVERMTVELTGGGDADEARDAVTVIATGGLAPLVIDETSSIDVHDEWLTLRGLQLVFARNAPDHGP